MDRREFLRLFGASAATLAVPTVAWSAAFSEEIKSFGHLDATSIRDVHRLRISPVSLEIADNQVLRTVGYDGGSPGPILRMRAGVPTALEVTNQTELPETVHPHGMHVPAVVDGTPHENSPVIPPGGRYRFLFKPGPTGTRWYHSHSHAGGENTSGLYTGQQGVLIVEGQGEPGGYDREVILMTHDWRKFIRATKGKDALGPTYTINGKALGFGEPVRVRQGERALFRIVNGNAEEVMYLALPGHRFIIVALDGNPVPQPQTVEVLRMGSGERIDAIVEMDNPGIWIFGDVRDKRRGDGLGIIVEYADKNGQPQWQSPKRQDWDYTQFGKTGPVIEPDERIEMVFDRGEKSGKRPWRINGKPFWDQETYKLRVGKRYRLIFKDKSNRLHPLHLHRHSFELTNVEGKPTAGIIKDTVCIEPNGHVEVDFVADQPGLSLFHCHMQNHMNKGFASLFETV